MGIGFFEEDSEFFAAVSGRDIDFADGGLEDLSDLVKDAVACGVSVGIVDTFEVVDIEHQDGERAFESAGGFELCVSAFHEGAVVEESGQSVTRGEVFHACEVLEMREEGGDVVGEGAEVLFGFFGGEGLGITSTECDDADGLVMKNKRDQIKRADLREMIGVILGEERATRAEVSTFGERAFVFEGEREERRAERKGLIEELSDSLGGGEDSVVALISFDAGDKAPVERCKARSGFEGEGCERAFGGGAVEALSDFVESVEVLIGAVGTSVGAFALEDAGKEYGGGLEHTFFAGRKGDRVDAIRADGTTDLFALSDGDGEHGVNDGVTGVIGEVKAVVVLAEDPQCVLMFEDVGEHTLVDGEGAVVDVGCVGFDVGEDIVLAAAVEPNDGASVGIESFA